MEFSTRQTSSLTIDLQSISLTIDLQPIQHSHIGRLDITGVVHNALNLHVNLSPSCCDVAITLIEHSWHQPHSSSLDHTQLHFTYCRYMGN